MAEILFTDWLNKLNASLASENIKFLLFLDVFTAHSPNKGNKSHKFSNLPIYYPANCTSVTKPIDQCIIQSLWLIIDAK